MDMQTEEQINFLEVGAELIVKEEQTEDESPQIILCEKPASEKFNWIPCKECKSQYDSEEKLNQHVRRVHRGEKAFLCNICDYKTSNSTRFEEHTNMHQGIKPYKCKHCDYKTVSKKYLGMHERKHVICVCGFNARSDKALSKHLANDCKSAPVEEGKFSCGNCNKKFSTKENMTKHLNKIKPCTICLISICPHKVNAHLKDAHNLILEKEAREMFSCNHCEFKTVTEFKYLLHLIHHPQPVEYDIDVSILVKHGILKDTAKSAGSL